MATLTCPLCPRTFETEKAFVEHLVRTTKHEGMVEHIAALTSQLEQAEEAVAIYREQRNEFRAMTLRPVVS